MDQAAIRITHTGGYQFAIDFGEAWPSLTADEPEPIGAGTGPSPEHLVAAGVANCLCASLVFALGKYRAQPSGLAAEASFKVHRNAAGRLRMESISVTITLGGVANADAATRALAKFQDFCTVSESVAAGIPIAVSVVDPGGKLLHRSPGEAVAAEARPEDAPAAFVERANRGDLDGLVALYDPDAVIAIGDPVATGHAEIRAFLQRMLEKKSSFDPVEVLPALRHGDLALTVTRAGGDKYSVELMRRQPDGSWRMLIDQLRVAKRT